MANKSIRLGQAIVVHKGKHGEKGEKIQVEVIGIKSGKGRVTYFLGKVIGKETLCLVLPVFPAMQKEIHCEFFAATFVEFGKGKFAPDLKSAAKQLNFDA